MCVCHPYSTFQFRVATCQGLSSKLCLVPILDSAVQYCPDFPTPPLLNPILSGFCLHHSTETALVKVSNNLHFALSRDQISAYILPNLPAAFNTVDHSFLLDKLSSLGFQDTTLSRLSSDLTGCCPQTPLPSK